MRPQPVPAEEVEVEEDNGQWHEVLEISTSICRGWFYLLYCSFSGIPCCFCCIRPEGSQLVYTLSLQNRSLYLPCISWINPDLAVSEANFNNGRFDFASFKYYLPTLKQTLTSSSAGWIQANPGEGCM